MVSGHYSKPFKFKLSKHIKAQVRTKSTVLPFVPLSQRVYTFLNRMVTSTYFFLTGTLIGQVIIQVVMSVPNNNDLPQRHTQSKQPDHSILLEPRGAIDINDEPTDVIVDSSTPLDIDIDQLRDELGLQKTLKILSDRIVKLSDLSQSTESVESSNVRQSPQFDPSGDLTSNVPALETADITQIALDSSEFLPSIFEETETFGPDVAAAIAQRVNDAVSKKPLDTKFKELQDN